MIRHGIVYYQETLRAYFDDGVPFNAPGKRFQVQRGELWVDDVVMHNSIFLHCHITDRRQMEKGVRSIFTEITNEYRD